MAEHTECFAVHGMGCASCANAVERALEDIVGVWQVSVNVAVGTAIVTAAGHEARLPSA